MPTPFDPYYEWLGIPPEAQPANYYRLLGVMLYESNPSVISNATDQKMLFIRTFQTGVHSAESQMILNELAQARVTLLNAESKEAYDNQLRVAMLSQEMPSQSPPIPGIPEEQPWAYIIDEQQFGPVSFTDIVNLINERRILPSTPVCESGQQAYLAGEHPKLISIFQGIDSNKFSPQLPEFVDKTPAPRQMNFAPLSNEELALFQFDSNPVNMSAPIGYNPFSVIPPKPMPLMGMVFVTPEMDEQYKPSPEERQRSIARLKARHKRIQEENGDKGGIDLNSNLYLLLAIIPFCIFLLVVFGFVYWVLE